MATIETTKLFKGDKYLICNVSDVARFEADGWGKQEEAPKAEAPKAEAPADPAPVQEAPAEGPAEAPAAEKPKAKKR